MSTKRNILVLLFFSVILSACEKPFGDKTDLSFIDDPNYDEKPIAFVPILPEIKLTGSPVDITVGYDDLIYIADKNAGKVISFDQSGRKVGEKSIPNAKAIAIHLVHRVVELASQLGPFLSVVVFQLLV